MSNSVMQTPPSVNGATKVMVASARAIGIFSADTRSGTHRKTIIAPTLLSANHDALAAEFDSDPLGGITGGLAVDLHGSAGEPEHGK